MGFQQCNSKQASKQASTKPSRQAHADAQGQGQAHRHTSYIKLRVRGEICWIVEVVVDKDLLVGILNGTELHVMQGADAKVHGARAPVVVDAVQCIGDGHVKLRQVTDQKVEWNACTAVALVVRQPHLSNNAEVMEHKRNKMARGVG